MNKEELAEQWVFETNGHKWSNNNGEAGDNYGSYLAGWDAAMKERDEEMVRFAEWCQNKFFRFEEVWADFNTLNVDGKTMKFTTIQLLEKFRSLPPSPPKE